MIELVISMSITVILLAGLSGSLAVSTRNQAQSDALFASTFNYATVPQQMVEDLELASAIISYSSTSVEFEVPDRNGDGWPEKIKYSWTGSSGANANKVQWTYNGQTAVDMVTEVTSFSLTYGLGTRTLDQLDNTRALLKQCSALSATSNQSFTVSSVNRCSQYFLPTLPNGTTSWSFGGFRFLARKKSGVTVAATDKLTIQVRTANTDKTPTSTVLSTTDVLVNRLGTDFDWVIVRPKLIRNLGSATGLCVVIQGSSSTGMVDVAFQQGTTTVYSNANYCTSSNSGSSWGTPVDTKCIRMFFYGGYPGYVSSRNFLMSTNIDMSSTIDGKPITASVRARMLNSPEVP